MNMNTKRFEQAIELGMRARAPFCGLDGCGRLSLCHLGTSDRAGGREANFAIEEWICPLTVKHLRENSKLAVLIWDSSRDDGYEILGEVLMFESQAYMNGFTPEVEEDGHLPQVKRKLIIRAEKILALSHTLRCDGLQPLAERRNIMETKETKTRSLRPPQGRMSRRNA